MDKKADWLKLGFWASGIIFLWMGSAYFLTEVLSRKPDPKSIPPTTGDLATIFFGASSLAMVIFSLLLAMAAIIEWQSLKSDVRATIDAAQIAQQDIARATRDNQERINNLAETMQRRFIDLESASDKRAQGLEKELRGRTLTVMGLMIGTLHSDPLATEQKKEDQDYLAEAILLCQKGYDMLKEVEGNGKYMALNNVVYYSCLLGLDSKRDLLLSQGREIKDIGQKYDSSPYLLTFCRVAWKYSFDPNEVRQALEISEALLDTRLTNIQKNEATLLVASLKTKLKELSGRAS